MKYESVFAHGLWQRMSNEDINVAGEKISVRLTSALKEHDNQRENAVPLIVDAMLIAWRDIAYEAQFSRTSDALRLTQKLRLTWLWPLVTGAVDPISWEFDHQKGVYRATRAPGYITGVSERGAATLPQWGAREKSPRIHQILLSYADNPCKILYKADPERSVEEKARKEERAIMEAKAVLIDRLQVREKAAWIELVSSIIPMPLEAEAQQERHTSIRELVALLLSEASKYNK